MNSPKLNLLHNSPEESRFKTLGNLYDDLYNNNSQIDLYGLGVLHQEVYNNGLDFGKIKIVRKNPWPLMLTNDLLLDNNLIKDLEAKYGIPRIILVELFGILQNTGFLKGGSIGVAPDAKSRFTDIEEAKGKIIGGITRHDLGNSLTKDEFMKSINKFLSELSQLNVIKEIASNQTKLEEIPNGLFRIASLYDTDFSRFDNLDDLLDFLFINLKEQDKLFGDKYLDLLKETSGFPIDDIPGRETTKFSQDKFVVKVGDINLGYSTKGEKGEVMKINQNIGVNFRIFPGFSPTGLGFVVSLDLEDIWGKKSNSNCLALYSLYFEKRGESIVPVIHTIQNNFHSIGIDNDGKLYQVDEPLSDEEKAKGITLLEENNGNIKLKKTKKQEIIRSIEKSILSGLDMNTEIIAIISDNLFFSGFSSIECINGSDNLWLTEHSGRTPEDIEKTIDGLYKQIFRTLGGKEIEYGHMKIDFLGVFKYLSRYPEGLDVLENISGLIGSLIGEANKLLIEPASQKNIQNAENFASKILEKLGHLSTRGTRLEHFVGLYTDMIGKQVGNLLDTSDGKRKVIAGINEARRYSRNLRVVAHKNRVEEDLSIRLVSLYNVSSKIEEIISGGGNVGYLPDLKNIVDAILLRKFY